MATKETVDLGKKGKIAIKKGALRAYVRRQYGDAGFNPDGTIKQSILNELARKGGTTGKRAQLAKTMKRWEH